MHHIGYLWLVSAICFSLPFLHVHLSLFIFPAFILLFIALEQTPNGKQVAHYAATLGIIKALTVLSWVWYIYPVSWMTQASTFAQLVVTTLYWVSAACVLAAGTAGSIIAIHLFRKYVSLIFLAPILWLGGEIAGSFLFSALTLGSGSTLQTHFSYGYVGYTIAHIPFLQSSAALAGVYALTALTVLLTTLFYTGLHNSKCKKSQKSLYVASFMLLLYLLASTGYHINRTPPPQNLDVIAVATALDKNVIRGQDGYTKRKEVAQTAVEQALAYAPDAIILPEDMRLTEHIGSPLAMRTFLQRNGKGPVTLIDSGRTRLSSTSVALRSFVFNTEQELFYSMDKAYLTPHGEYLPALHSYLMRWALKDSEYSTLVRDLSYIPTSANEYQNIPDGNPVILSCMESSWPSAAQRRTKNINTPYIAHTTSHSWFSRPPVTLWQQQTQMLLAQSIWSNTPIVTATNMAPHQVFMPAGTVLHGIYLEGTAVWSLYGVSL